MRGGWGGGVGWGVCVCVCVREGAGQTEIDKKGSIEIHFGFIIGKLLGNVSN